MPRTPLYTVHERLGAHFAEYEGWVMPSHYGSPGEEARAVRVGCGVSDLSHRGKLFMRGKDAGRFLQGMVTNDVLGLEPFRSAYAAILTPKGRMVSDLTIYRHPDHFLLDVEPGMGGRVRDYLLKYRLSFKAEIEDATEALALVSLCGAKAGDVARAVFEEAYLPDEGAFVEARLGGADVIVAGVNRIGEKGFDIYAPAACAEGVWEALAEAGGAFGIRPFGMEAMEVLRVEAGIPRFGVDMGEDTIPLEAGIDHAISYEKGCYVGQEVVARIHWRGHVNRKLVGFTFSSTMPPRAGARVKHGERDVGYITSSIVSPHVGGPIALGYIRRELTSPGTPVMVEVEGGVVQAAVASTPFVRARDQGS
ncbi:MAG: aminomethyltransferase family protein [Candidatus Methanosuratincola sp.]